MPRVFLVRHAAHGLLGKVLAGRMPGVSLSDDGRRQAERLAGHFAESAAPQRILSSPRERCLETAAPIATRCGLLVEADAALDEIDCGDWTGLRFEEIARDPAFQTWNRQRGAAAVPGGEAAAAVAARTMALLGALAEDEREPVVVVTHADGIKFAVLSLLGASLDVHDRIDIEPASITTVDLWRGGGKVVRSNQQVTA